MKQKQKNNRRIIKTLLLLHFLQMSKRLPDPSTPPSVGLDRFKRISVDIESDTLISFDLSTLTKLVKNQQLHKQRYVLYIFKQHPSALCTYFNIFYFLSFIL
jgi:hypothetical protein